mgnify:CR=1 FL=1
MAVGGSLELSSVAVGQTESVATDDLAPGRAGSPRHADVCASRLVARLADMDLSATTTINVPMEAVYAYVSDPANDVNWRTGVTESGLITDPPIVLGSEGFVKAGSKVVRWRVTAIEPGSSVDWELTEGPISGFGGYRLEDVGGSTRFTLVANVKPEGAFRLVGPLFARMGRKQNQADVKKLKGLLEA